MEDGNIAIAIIILTAGGLNNPIKNQKLSDRMKRFNYKLLTGDVLQIQEYKWVESKRMKKDI